MIEKTIHEIKNVGMKSITSLDMNLSSVTLNNPSLPSEHLNSHLMPQILLKASERSPQFINHMFYLNLEGTTKLQLRKWWIDIISEFYLSFFLPDFCQYLLLNSIRCSTQKHSKIQFNYSKQQLFIHQQYQYQMSNLNESRNFIM